MSQRKIDEEWFKQHYPYIDNNTICKKFDCTIECVKRMQRRLGLKKDPKYLSRMRREQYYSSSTPEMKKNFLENVAPLGRRKWTDEKRKRLADHRRKLYADEKRRVLYGLPQKTNVKVTRQAKKKVSARNRFKERGYIVVDQRTFIAPQERKQHLEEIYSKKYGFKFIESKNGEGEIRTDNAERDGDRVA